MKEKKRDDPADWFMLLIAIFIVWMPVIIGELNKHQQEKLQNPTTISSERDKK